MASERDRLTGLSLTAWERKVLNLMVQGLTDQEIAQRLRISIHSVHRHRERLTAKTGLHGRVRLAVLAARLDLGQPA